MHDFAIGQALANINWYARRKETYKRMSQGVRYLATLFATLGALVPVLVAMGVPSSATILGMHFGQGGYLLFALGAAIMGLDRYFGFSTGWIRFITTSLAIERLVQDFQVQWNMMLANTYGPIGGVAPDCPPTASQLQDMLAAIKAFVSAVGSQVDSETKAWVTEFQNSMAQLDRSLSTQQEAQKPGAINLQVDGLDKLSGPYTVSLDGTVIGTGVGPAFPIGQISPGIHTVHVTGSSKEMEGRTLVASQSITVAAGSLAQAVIKLA